MNTVKYFISCKDKDGKISRNKVSRDVYFYILQLEAYIKNPDESKLKEVYRERFGG